VNDGEDEKRGEPEEGRGRARKKPGRHVDVRRGEEVERESWARSPCDTKITT
jgi:hypothetical protein